MIALTIPFRDVGDEESFIIGTLVKMSPCLAHPCKVDKTIMSSEVSIFGERRLSGWAIQGPDPSSKLESARDARRQDFAESRIKSPKHNQPHF